jgi:hypothetical protein
MLRQCGDGRWLFVFEECSDGKKQQKYSAKTPAQKPKNDLKDYISCFSHQPKES